MTKTEKQKRVKNYRDNLYYDEQHFLQWFVIEALDYKFHGAETLSELMKNWKRECQEIGVKEYRNK